MNFKSKKSVVLLLTMIMFLIFNNISALENPQNDSPFPKNKISFTFSPELAYRSVSSSNSTNNFWSSEKPISSFSTGIAFLHSFNRKFEIETGLNYSIKGFQIPNIVMTTVDQPDARDPKNLYSVKYRYRFIDIPLKFNTLFNIKNLKCYVSTGAVGNVLMNGKAILINKNDRDIRQKFELDLKEGDFTLSGHLGFGITHILSQKWILRTDLHLQHQFLVSSTRSVITRKFYNAGLGISLLYFLK
jgi:hypothetical protein